MKKLLVGEEARLAAVSALSEIADAVGSTLGPQGQPFVFERMGADQRYKPTASKDGLTILNSLEFDEPIKNAVHFFAQQASAHSVMASGDGTTSTVVLAAAVAKAVNNSKQKIPQAFARQIRREAMLAIDLIRKEADKSESCVRKVALTSANGDEELVDYALEAVNKSSAFGTILIEKSPAARDRYKIVKSDGYVGGKGYNYNNVFASSCASEATENAPFEWPNANICILNGSLFTSDVKDAILKAFQDKINLEGTTDQKLVIFAFDAADELLNELIVFNRKMAKFGIAVFVAKPRLTAEINSGLQLWRDIESYTGAVMVDGGNYRSIIPSMFGKAKKVKITPTQTVLLGRADNHWVEQRVQQNQNIIDTADSQFDKEITSIRNSELAEGLVKIEVGGGLLPDIQERADRCDDAVKAAQSSMRAGALPGCGASYIRAAELAMVCSELSESMATIHKKIMQNFGEIPVSVFPIGQTCYIDDNGVAFGDFKDLGVMDAAETVCAVIRNGVELGLLVATLGGYSLINRQSLEEIQRNKTMRDGG